MKVAKTRFKYGIILIALMYFQFSSREPHFALSALNGISAVVIVAGTIYCCARIIGADIL